MQKTFEMGLPEKNNCEYVILLFELRYHCDLSGSALSLAQAIDQYIMSTNVLLPLLYS